MKGTLVFVTVVLLIAQTFCLRSPNSSSRKQQFKYITKEVIRPSDQAAKVGLDLCSTCVSFSGQAIGQLLNIILNVGVIGSCGELCTLLSQKIPGQLLNAVCNILCDIAGVEEFVKLVEKADLDPIYLCELLKTCPVKDDGDAKITSFAVTPKSGPKGEFVIGFVYMSNNGTGTGEIDLRIDTVDKIPVGENFLHEEAKAGTYDGSFKLKAEPDPSCDPTQQPCEQWVPGVYTVKMAICNGECGSKHPHSAIYDEATTTFTITG